MLALLSQITATFLSIIVAFLVAYEVYLSTSKANIDAQIQEEGTEIAQKLVDNTIYEIPSLYHDFYLTREYQIKNPDLGGLQLLERLAFDLSSGGGIETDDYREICQMAQRGNIAGRMGGRVAFWIIEKLVDSLAPKSSVLARPW